MGHRRFDANRPSRFGNASGQGGFNPRNTLTRANFGSDRPVGTRSAALGGLSRRGTSNWTNTSRFAAQRDGAGFGGSRFSGGRFAGASFSRFGNRPFWGSRGERFHSAGYGRGWGYGNRGFHPYGYGFAYRGWGDPWDSDLWFLGDLFGLALDFSRLAILPTWGLAPSLLDAGLQALNSIDSNDDSYGNSYEQYDSRQDYDAGPYYPTSAEVSYPALCGRYYSDENPGCRQEF